MKQSEIALETKDLTKSFPGVLALDNVNLRIFENEVVGLVGENGAGKSTLLKILVGLQQPDSGSVQVRGKQVVYKNVSEASDLGIGMVFQEQSLIPNISVAENIFLGNEGSSIRMGIYDWKDLFEKAAFQLAKLGSNISPEAITEDLSFTQRQLVEFARVLSTEERTKDQPIILLDEPTSVLEGEELEQVLKLVCEIKKRASVIFISHRLEEVLRVSDRIYVMTNGRCVAECKPDEVSVQELEELMLGAELRSEYDKEFHVDDISDRDVVLSIKNISLKDSYTDISFDLHAGEIVGFAGVVGSGREDLCRTIFGAEGFDRGEITLEEERIALCSPAGAVERGIGYIPSERRSEGIIGDMSVMENVSLTHLRSVMRGPVIEKKKEEDLVNSWISKLKIKTPSLNTMAGTLSGGNQQKVVIAKWLISEQPKLIVMDHPMRGLDVGAKAEVFELIRNLSQNGIGIVLIADTLEELIALSNTIFVMRDGIITAKFEECWKTKPSKLEILERMI